MKVMVCLKQVPHQDSRLDVNADGTWIQDSNIKFEIKLRTNRQSSRWHRPGSGPAQYMGVTVRGG